VYTQLKKQLHPRLQDNIAKWGRAALPAEWNALDSTSQMRLLFYRSLIDFNDKARMSYTNIAIVNELYTTLIQWFIHPGNATWSNWLIPLQIVPQKAHLYRILGREGFRTLAVDKPNSTGLDEIVIRAFDGVMILVNGEVTRSDGQALDLGMCKAGRETPCARERRNKVMICKNTVITEPDPAYVNRLQSTTEERNLSDADLDAKIRVTPRNRMSIRDGTVFTTDVNDKGGRDSQRWESCGGYHIGAQATNSRINSMKNQEQWETQLIATKCMSTGRDQEKKRKRVHRGDFVVNHASGNSQSVRVTAKCKELSTLLCVLPHLTGAFIGMMNKLGFTAIEIAPITTMYMDFMQWRFDTLFNRFVGVRLSKSFQRTCLGHYGRHIADYAMARLTLESAKTADFDTALATTFSVLEYNCLPLGAIPTWFDDSARECVDGQLLVLHQVLTPMLDIPCLSLSFLCKALLPYDSLSEADQVYVDTHPDAKVLAEWVKGLIDNQCFVCEEESGWTERGGDNGADTNDRAKTYFPYITTSAKATEEYGYLRAFSKNNILVEEISRKIVKHPELMAYSRNTGFSVDETVVRCMLDHCAHIALGLENAFGCYELCNPETIFALARRQLGGHAIVPPISDSVMQNVAAFLDPPYSMLAVTAIADGVKKVTFGVHMTLAVILTSMSGGETSPNSNVDERLARSLMYLMLRDVPAQFLGQSGDQYLRKNFRGNCPVVDIHSVAVLGETRPAYFVRPVHDHQKGNNTLSYFPCTVYLNYAPEDLAHMGELTALALHYKVKSILDLSLTFATPHYMFLFNVIYPVAFTNEGICMERKRLGFDIPERVRGYLIVRVHKDGTTPWKIRYYGEHGAHHNAQGDNVCDLDEALAVRHTVALPLLQRHNAVVYCDTAKAFGVVLPLETEPADLKTGSYFNNSPNIWGYRVLFENKVEDTTINALQLEHMLVPLAKQVFIRLDVYFNCRGRNAGHGDVPRFRSNNTIVAPTAQYVTAVVTYPHNYPSSIAQTSSIFVEVAYSRGTEGSEQYVPMEISLPMLRGLDTYSKHANNPPISYSDPRRSLVGDDISNLSLVGDNVSIIGFTSNGFH
jgi:hypothetical protein